MPTPEVEWWLGLAVCVGIVVRNVGNALGCAHQKILMSDCGRPRRLVVVNRGDFLLPCMSTRKTLVERALAWYVASRQLPG
jgi:hypothetical protein